MANYNCAWCGDPVDAGKNAKEEDKNAERHLKVCTGIDRELYKKHGTITGK